MVGGRISFGLCVSIETKDVQKDRVFINFVLYEARGVRDLRRNIVEYEDQAKRAFMQRKQLIKRTRHMIEYLIRDEVETLHSTAETDQRSLVPTC